MLSAVLDWWIAYSCEVWNQVDLRRMDMSCNPEMDLSTFQELSCELFPRYTVSLFHCNSSLWHNWWPSNLIVFSSFPEVNLNYEFLLLLKWKQKDAVHGILEHGRSSSHGFITCLALVLATAMDGLQQCSTVCKAKYRYQPLIMFHFLSTVKLILQNLSGLQSRNR